MEPAVFATGYTDYMPEIMYYVHRKCTYNWVIEQGCIDFIDLTYVAAGSAVYQIGSTNYRVTAGDLLCIPNGSVRSAAVIPDDLMECYCTNIGLRNQSGAEVALPFPLICSIGYRPDIIALYRDLNAEWLRRSPGFRLKVHAVMLTILHRYFELIVYKQDSGLMDKRVKKLLRYIADHYTEPMDVKELAKLAELNPVYLGNLFKQSTGMTFRQYLTSIRLNHAEDMLRSGEYNVNEAAALCGFSDVFYFSKVFKEKRGCAPSLIYRNGGGGESPTV